MEQPISTQNITGGTVGVAARDIHGNVTVHMPASAPPTAPAQLRAPTSDFVGRTEEEAALVAALRTSSTTGGMAAISGVRGMGGIGKSELAYLVAARMRDQFDFQIYLDMRGAQGEAAISSVQALQTVITAFGSAEKLPDDEPALTARYCSLLANKRVLVFADDARDAAQVRPLMPPPGSALLVTSRFLFELDGMKTVDLKRLSDTQAVALLQTINSLIPEPIAKHIAELCGNLPLALRIVAGITKKTTRTLDEYVDLLRDELTRLGGMVDTRAMRSVEASLSLSYRFLSTIEQQVLALMGVFSGNFDRQAVAKITAQEPTTDLVAVLDVLHEYSLLDYDQEEMRYSLHELVRVFALARLRERGDEEDTRLRHARHSIQLAEQAQRQFMSGGEGITSGLALFDRERTQIDGARAWLQRHTAGHDTDELLIADAYATAHIGDLRYLKRTVRMPQLETALKAAQNQSNEVAQGKILNHLGLAYADVGKEKQALELYERALKILCNLSDRWNEGRIRNNVGLAYMSLGKMRPAIKYLTQALEISRDIDIIDREGEGNALGNLGSAYNLLGKPKQSIDYHTQALLISYEMDNKLIQGQDLGNLANAYARSGKVDRAIECYQQQLDIAQQIGHRHSEGNAIGNLAIVYAEAGEIRHAIELFEQHRAIAHEIHDLRGECNAIDNLIEAHTKLGDRDQVLELRKQRSLVAPKEMKKI